MSLHTQLEFQIIYGKLLLKNAAEAIHSSWDCLRPLSLNNIKRSYNAFPKTHKIYSKKVIQEKHFYFEKYSKLKYLGCEREDSWKVEIVKMIGNWKFINVGKH